MSEVDDVIQIARRCHGELEDASARLVGRRDCRSAVALGILTVAVAALAELIYRAERKPPARSHKRRPPGAA